MPRRALAPAVLVVLLVLPHVAGADIGSVHERRIERALATPTPAGPLEALSDEARWRVEVPAHVVVQIDADARGATPFTLGWWPAGSPRPPAHGPPSRHLSATLSAGTWIVEVDPVAGAGVDVHVLFRGHVLEAGGPEAAFTLHDLPAQAGCLVGWWCPP